MKHIRILISLSIIVSLVLLTIDSGISVIIAKALTYTVDSLPDYTSVPYVEIDNNNPRFDESDYTFTAFEEYSDLDELGRCSTAFALVCLDTMPTDSRGSISSVTPTGWKQSKYDTSLVSGGYIYNRCHLIGWQLTGENANCKNLITGTRYMNIDGMVGFENLVADYVKNCDGHVLYRVTPIFEDENLLASGVLMEALSEDDNGDSVSFFIYCFNVQPGITIDYKTGDNSISIIIVAEDDTKYIFVLNISSKKYHRPDCRYSTSMNEKNRQMVKGAKCCPEEDGYVACSVCNADVSPQLSGDIDLDNSVSVFDSRLILRFALGIDNSDEIMLLCCDADSDNEITVSDARSILRIAIGLEI